MKQTGRKKIEVVFFPYKYAMADSLESIWLAAMEDSDCNVSICPIPYYELTPGGGNRKLHDESGSYSKDLPLVDWHDYDIEKKCPDIAFIHNPSDNCNLITNVHPNFYSIRLLEHTKLLCYSPYFVVSGKKIPDGLVVLPGAIYAQKTFVQSEDVRQIYIRLFKEYEKERNCVGLFGNLETKFVALGSPKFDKVINAKVGNYNILGEWQKLIGDKKVILYCTSINAMLQSGWQYLSKMRHVLDTFRKHCNGIALWWRPHPHAEITLSAMRPQLLPGYKQIVSDYIRDGWGIYDDTSDLHAAIYFSNACYCDGGTFRSLYPATGKPIMIVNQKIFQKQFVPALSMPICVTGDSIWFCIRHLNALFRMDKTTWTAELVGCFPNEKDLWLKHSDNLYFTPVEHNGTLYFPPRQAKEIAAYSPQDDTFEKFPFATKLQPNEIAFNGAAAHGDFVFFIPLLYPAIVRLSIETKEINYFDDWLDELNQLLSDTSVGFFSAPVVVGSTIWLACRRTNAVLEFDMETCTSVIHEVGQKGYRYLSICFDGEYCWLSPFPGTGTPLVKWAPRTSETKEFSEIYSFNSINTEYNQIVHCGGYVWLLASRGIGTVKSIKIDAHTDTVDIADEFQHDYKENVNITPIIRYYHIYAKSFENSIYVFNWQKKTLVEYNLLTKERKEKAITFPQELISMLEPVYARMAAQAVCYGNINKINTETDCYFIENNKFNLNDFIEYITSDGCTEAESAIKSLRAQVALSTNANTDGRAGKNIFHHAKATFLKARVRHRK